MNRRTTSQRAQKLVSGAVEMMRVGIELQIAHHSFDDLGDVFPRKQRRYATKGQACWSERIQVEPGALPFGPAFEDGVHLVPLELDHNRLEQMLRCGVTIRGVLRFEPFVQDALVRGVHVDEDQAVAVLREDVDAVQLRQGGAERVMLRRPRRSGTWRCDASAESAGSRTVSATAQGLRDRLVTCR